ncbi:hypothetical protein AAG906_001584 [Vitis piasezkii]
MKNSRGHQLFKTFGALPGVHLMHTICRFEAHGVSNPTLQTVHESDQTSSEDVSSENGWLDFSFLGAKDFLELPTLGKLLYSKETSISYLLRAFEGKSKVKDHLECGGRLVKRDTPHNKELELSLNIMEATPEDQHSHHDNPNAFRSMRDRMHPPQNEKFYECWERYMEAINACPHHGFDTWLLQLLETMCGGDFMNKNLEEAMDFLSYVAEVSRDGMNQTKEKWER